MMLPDEHVTEAEAAMELEQLDPDGSEQLVAEIRATTSREERADIVQRAADLADRSLKALYVAREYRMALQSIARCAKVALLSDASPSLVRELATAVQDVALAFGHEASSALLVTALDAIAELENCAKPC